MSKGTEYAHFKGPVNITVGLMILSLVSSIKLDMQSNIRPDTRHLA